MITDSIELGYTWLIAIITHHCNAIYLINCVILFAYSFLITFSWILKLFQNFNEPNIFLGFFKWNKTLH